VIAKTGTTVFWFGWLIVFFSAFTFAQSQTTGRIAGTVKDPNGAIIIGAEVAVKSLATAEERKVTTDAEGNYTVSFLPPGMYRIKVAAQGFNSDLYDSVRVIITETTTVNPELEVAGVIVDAVTVDAAPLVRTDGPQLGRVVDSRAVAELLLEAFALIYTGLGDKNRAFEFLKKEYEENQRLPIFINTLPEWDSLRSDPRFTELLQRTKLVP